MTGAITSDDSQVVQAVYQLPSLALPPITGLLVILGAYILIIGPINYLILKRLDRRELAWVTMPVLVLAFAAASFGYGSILRGTDVVINEIAIVRGAPDATEATANVYFGIFSPTRSTYQVDVPQGAQLGFKHDVFAGHGLLVQEKARVCDIGQQRLTKLMEPGHYVLEPDRLRAIGPVDGQVFPVYDTLHPF
jgi:hypothetical protein